MTHVTHRRRAPHVSELGPINDLGTLLNSQSRAPAAHTQTLPPKSRIVFTRAPGLPRSRCRSFTRPRERNPRMIAIDWAPSNAVRRRSRTWLSFAHVPHTCSSHILLTHAPHTCSSQCSSQCRNAPRNAIRACADTRSLSMQGGMQWRPTSKGYPSPWFAQWLPQWLPPRCPQLQRAGAGGLAATATRLKGAQ